jgi:thioredoxin 1
MGIPHAAWPTRLVLSAAKFCAPLPEWKDCFFLFLKCTCVQCARVGATCVLSAAAKVGKHFGKRFEVTSAEDWLRPATSKANPAAISAPINPIDARPVRPQPLKYLDTEREFKKFLQAADQQDKAVLIDFTATWCPPCKRIGPVFERMAAEPHNQGLCFAKVDVDRNAAVAQRCGVHAMPTFQLWRQGRKLEEMSGANESVRW